MTDEQNNSPLRNNGNLFITTIWMDHAPHMDPVRREQILAGYPQEEYNARRYAIPSRGVGRIFKTPIDDVVVPWYQIPKEWIVCVGLDVGNSDDHATVAMFIAKNPVTGALVIFDEYYSRGRRETYAHAHAILERGINPPIAFDYGGNRTTEDLLTTRELYEREGLDKIYNANKAVSAGIAKMNDGFANMSLKVMANCSNFIREYSQYYFEKDGKPCRKNNDTIDAARYGILKIDEIGMPYYACLKEEEQRLYDEQSMVDSLVNMTARGHFREGY